MSKLRLHLSDPQFARRVSAPMPLGRHLVEAGAISTADLLRALEIQRYVDAPLGEILVSEGITDRRSVLEALSKQHSARIVDLMHDPPQPALATKIPVDLCLKFHAVPWMDMGGALLAATNRPHQFEALKTALGPGAPTILPVLADDRDISRQITRLYGRGLAYRAATRVPAHLSCRTWNISGKGRVIWALVCGLMLLIALLVSPLWTFTALILFTFITLLMTTGLKAAGLLPHLLRPDEPPVPERITFTSETDRLPRVSVLVPLLREKEIANALIARLTKLTYPKCQLDVVLVLEEGDLVTRQTLQRTTLPPWIRVIEVPAAHGLMTKPRALNYALDFCEGSIIGVWDAEDAPATDQVERVVARFHHAPANVACLQGVLDYYNPKSNWLSRCFTIEYAAWWRVLLPGIERLGLVLPLGGTTLFFRRNVLEELKGWDAHNVTEDADLGVRLARAGYVTELIPTVTYEEANCRLWPWVRQRSRWLKGFLITWCVHMRNPAQLLSDLGWWRFLGVQTMLLATFCQFLLAPLLWSFWLALAGLTHPVETALGAPVLWAMVITFILAETLNLALSGVAVQGKAHRHLMWWVFTMPVYFLFGAIAAAKALQEFVVSPFYWDKTEHGVTSAPEGVTLLAPVLRLPASTG